jgi:DNA-binding GntR family transcriptional regulator
LDREPLTRRAVQAIRDAIFAGEYLPGQRLVEEELAASLGVSRNVVREAFWQLEAQFLVQSDDYKGKSVTALTFADMMELIPLRLSLESLAATWAARNINPEQAKALRRQMAMMLDRIAGPNDRFADAGLSAPAGRTHPQGNGSLRGLARAHRRSHLPRLDRQGAAGDAEAHFGILAALAEDGVGEGGQGRIA